MAGAILALTILSCIMAAQAQTAGQSCTIANMIPWPVPGSLMDYFMCVDGITQQLTCPRNTIFIGNNLNVFGCVPTNLVTCQYNQNGNYWNNNNNNYYPYSYQNNYYPQFSYPNEFGNNPPVLYPTEVGNNQNGYNTVFVPGSNNNNYGYPYPGSGSYYNPNGIPGAVSDGNVIIVPSKK